MGEFFQVPDNAFKVITPVDDPRHRLGLETQLPGDFRRTGVIDDTQDLKTLAVYFIITRDEGRSDLPPTRAC